jgi:predicted ATPase
LTIREFGVENCKCFAELTTLHLTSGFNVITGRNNAGKTALMEALSQRFTAKPHRSLRTAPDVSTPAHPTSTIKVTFSLERKELLSMLNRPMTTWNIPIPTPDSDMARQIGLGTIRSYEDALCVEQWLTSQNRTQYKTIRTVLTEGPPKWTPDGTPSFATYRPVKAGSGLQYLQRRVDSLGRVSHVLFNGPDDQEIGGTLAFRLTDSIYKFDAERFGLSIGPLTNEATLKPNASNLTAMMDRLSGNPVRFARYKAHVSEVLPEVRDVSLFSTAENAAVKEIRIWTADGERPDLTFPLSECGTGVGQALAILYVVVASDSPQVVLVDEPQSFLHPGASRKLVDILGQYPHQYIISTHSPTIISACNPESVAVVRNHDGLSTIEEIDITRSRQARIYLAEVGATPSDVFGADNVIWVEGATEELCFPRILAQRDRRLMGTVIRGVRSTSDFEGKHADAVIEIYGRVTSAGSLYPPALSFIFDRELRSEGELEDIKRRASRLEGSPPVLFTKRRMYESYLLHGAAIAAILNQDDVGKTQECAA